MIKLTNYEKIIIIGDHHIPYHDKKTVNILNKFLKKEKPDTLIINGDFLDFYDLSVFDKDLFEEGKLQTELDIGYNLLKKLRIILPKTKIIMTESNHMEKRLLRFKRKMGRAVFSLRYMSIKEMLQLDKLNIQTTYMEKYKKFVIHHGQLVRKHSAYSAKANYENIGKSSFNNHTHRLGSYYVTNETGTHVSVECGCLCTLNPSYMDGVPNWQQGFAVIYLNKKTNWYQHYLIPIIDHSFIWNGVVYN